MGEDKVLTDADMDRIRAEWKRRYMGILVPKLPWSIIAASALIACFFMLWIMSMI